MKRHAFDGLSFFAGLVITGVGLAFLLVPDLFDLVDLFTDAGSWFWAVVLIAVGIAIIAPAVTKRSVSDTENDETATPSGDL
jgi:hypothetical protein